MKKKHNVIFTISLLCVGLIAITINSCGFLPEDKDETQQEATKLNINEMSLVWSDEFTSGSSKTAPSSANWTFEKWAAGKVNNEKQQYIDSLNAAYVSDGTLKIRAYKSGSNWYSARLKTEDALGNRSWKYGYFEAKIKMPKGTGVWPAFWMMPHDPTGKSGDGAYGTWPKSGELDIMEYSPGTQGKKVYATVHHSKSAEEITTDKYETLGSKEIDDVTTAFHTYGLYWTETYIEAFIDGVSLGVKYKNENYNSGKSWIQWPYDQKYYIILNLAMGGNLGGNIDSSLTEAIYEIDYVRVYQ